MKKLAIIAAALALASCTANGGVGIGTGTGGGLGLGAGLSFPVGGKTEAPAQDKHITKECGKFADTARATSREASLKMCKMGARHAVKDNGDEVCARHLESYAKEQPSQQGQDHDVYAENTAAYAYGCDIGKASRKGEDLQGNAINRDAEDDADDADDSDE